MAKKAEDHAKIAPSSDSPSPQYSEGLGAAFCLGILLALLVGLSNSPVVSTVTTGIVGLLAAMFGLSDKAGLGFSENGGKRLLAFTLGAVVFLPVGILVRTNDLLGPSLERQTSMLREMKITEPAEQKDMLKFLRFGILPAGSTTPAKEPVAVTASRGGLYNASASECESLRRRQESALDVIATLETGNQGMIQFATVMRSLPAADQKAAGQIAFLYFCTTRP